METLAEEMRILYVALTRPKEKMFLVGTVADAAKQLQRWQTALDSGGNLPDFRLAQAKRFIDWVGPLAMNAGIPITIESDTASGLAGIDNENRGAEAVSGNERGEQQAVHPPIDFMRAAKEKPEGSFRDWRTAVVPSSALGMEAAAAVEVDEAAAAAFEERLQAVQALVPIPMSPYAADEIERRLTWQYPYMAATTIAAKTSVTEMKRLHAETTIDEDAAVLLLSESVSGATESQQEERERELQDQRGQQDQQDQQEQQDQLDQHVPNGEYVIPDKDDDYQLELLFDESNSSFASQGDVAERTSSLSASAGIGSSEYTFRLRRPKFMEEASLTAAERGTVGHLVMQHMPLAALVDEQLVRDTVAQLQERSMLSKMQAQAVDITGVAAFFQEEVGKRLAAASWVRRETPFSCTLPASRVYPQGEGSLAQEPILIQGVIDCLFEDEGGLVLLDYKTDNISKKNPDEAAERHRFQLELYAEAIERIMGRKVNECYVFFFDGAKSVKLF